MKLSNEIKTFIYYFLSQNNRNLKNIFNFLSIHLSEIILMLRNFLDQNINLPIEFTKLTNFNTLDDTINNFLDQIISKEEINCILRIYGKLYNIYKLINGKNEDIYSKKIKSFYKTKCVVVNETFFIYVNEFKEIIKNLNNENEKIIDKNDELEELDKIKKYLDEISLIINNLNFIEEEDLLNFDIIIEKMNNNLDCLYFHFVIKHFIIFPLNSNIQMIINKLEKFYQLIYNIYEGKKIKIKKKKNCLHIKILENFNFYNWINKYICLSNENSNKINEKEILNLFILFSNQCQFNQNENFSNIFRIRSILLLSLIHFQSPEFLRNFLSIFSHNLNDFTKFFTVIDEFFNVLLFDNLIKKINFKSFIEILNILLKSMSLNRVPLSKVPHIQEKLENKLLRFMFNYYSSIDITNNQLSELINLNFKWIKDCLPFLVSSEKFSSLIQSFIFHNISLKILNNFIQNEIMIDDYLNIINSLIQLIENEDLVQKFIIFQFKIMKVIKNQKVPIKLKTLSDYLIFLNYNFIEFETNLNLKKQYFQNDISPKVKAIEESFGNGLRKLYKIQKLLKNHPFLGINLKLLNEISLDIDLNVFKFEKLIDLVEFYNYTFIFGFDFIQERIINFVGKSSGNFPRIQSFLKLNYINEKMTQYSNKFRPFINKDDKIIMYDEINKLLGIFQINDDMNDSNV